jgi:hypothetical protein
MCGVCARRSYRTSHKKKSRKRLFCIELLGARFSTLLIVADTLGVTLDELAAGIPVPKERKPSPPTKRKGRGKT